MSVTQTNGEYSVSDVLACITGACKVVGNEDLEFSRISPIFEVEEGSLSWIRSVSREIAKDIYALPSCILIVDIDHLSELINSDPYNNKCFIGVKSPRLAFSEVLNSLFGNRYVVRTFSIHPTAIIDKDAVIGAKATIGPYAVLGKCRISENCVIGAFTSVGDGVEIGNNVVIHEHCLIGSDGFGFERDNEGSLNKIKHIGGVVIEDDVEIYPFSNVDRATLTNTRILKGAKIDHYVHVGHNTTVGRHAVLAAKTVLCGGSSVGNYSWIGVCSVIRDSLVVGDNATIGMGTMITKNVPGGETWVGSPGMELSGYKSMRKNLRQG